MTKTAAIIGGGVIGGGWAARFLLNGWDVNISDPDPETERKINEVMANARRSLPGLADVVMPEEGCLTFSSSITKAVEGVEWIQESVPERLDFKRNIYAQIQKAAPSDAVIGSSSSGFKPSLLKAGSTNPAQIMVCHPFNPVYLLPLVEVVSHDDTTDLILKKAVDILKSIGMKPLHIKKEIDAHIADRLLEAVWRESLWLIKDGIASTQEIDDAIRFGFGIRWAQMGLFETYRIAGGEAGMEHFISQFAPALKWPWTKLMDVPELTDDLVKTITRQSEEQSNIYSIRELEQIRDNNLVTIMRGLKSQDWGVGRFLKNHDIKMQARHAQEIDFSKPIRTLNRVVPVDWADYNGHMNEARYLQALSEASDRFMEIIGCDKDYIANGSSYFTAETHLRHIDEVDAGATIYVETQCISGEGKKLHIFNTLFHEDGRLLTTGEHLLIHVNLKTRRSSLPELHVEEKLKMVAAYHAKLPQPESLGRCVGAPRS